jgi:NitT/TauT family transport system permease protein
MEITSRFVPDYIMPSPVAVWNAARELFFSDPYHVAVTLVRLTVSVTIAMVTGVLIGLAMGMFPSVRPYLKAIVVIDTGIPALSWMLIAVFWFKNPESRIFFILLVILLPFYALNVYEGVRALPKELVDMIESFRPSRWQVLRYLILPHIVAYIFLTTKSVIGYAIRMVIFAELVASAVGIGARMNLAQSTFRIDQVLAWTFFLVILNLLLQAFVNGLEKISLKWRAEATVR